METVRIEMNGSDRIRLDSQIHDRMEQLGFGRYAHEALELGFELPVNWPADEGCEITLAQLTELAYKLKMRIIIADLNMAPAASEAEKQKDEPSE